MNRGLLPLTETDIATCFVLGKDVAATPLPEVDPALEPLSAFENAIRPALARPPCLVSFSGGRDSSAVLAVATRLARQEGYDVPIPITLRFFEHPEAEESSWQELVIRHLDLSDWQRHVIGDELDWIGPVAQKVLLRHGVLFPAHAFMYVPMLEEAAGGSLLTGLDGDGLLNPGPWGRLMAVLARKAPPEPRDLLRLGLALAPLRLRVAVMLRRHALAFEWLRPDARKAFDLAYATEQMRQPRRWDKAVAWWIRQRDISLMRSSLGALARDARCETHHPFLDLRFLASVSRWGGRAGFVDRTAATRGLFRDLLPEVLLARPDKAAVSDVFWRTWSRSFVSSSELVIPDNSLIDEQALRTLWARPWPDARTSMLLQTAWLASRDLSGRSREGLVDSDRRQPAHRERGGLDDR